MPDLAISQSVAGYKAKLFQAAAANGPKVEFGELDEVDINKSRDMLDATSHSSAGAKVKKPGLIDWTGTAKGLHLGADVSQKAMRDALDGSIPLFVTIYPEGVGAGLTQLQGWCYIKDWKFTAPVKDLAKAEFSLEGSGLLAESVQGPVSPLTSIVVTPANPNSAVGATKQFTATAHYADASTADITAEVEWGSSNPAVATINDAGLVMGVAAGGPITISATYGGVEGSAQLTVA